jgi:hypothetical protein
MHSSERGVTPLFVSKRKKMCSLGEIRHVDHGDEFSAVQDSGDAQGYRELPVDHEVWRAGFPQEASVYHQRIGYDGAFGGPKQICV